MFAEERSEARCDRLFLTFVLARASSSVGRLRPGLPLFVVLIILTLRDPPRPGPAHPREHGDYAAPKSPDPKQ